MRNKLQPCELRRLRAYTWTFSKEELQLWEELLLAGAKEKAKQPKALTVDDGSALLAEAVPLTTALVPLADGMPSNSNAPSSVTLPTTTQKPQKSGKPNKKGKGKGKGQATADVSAAKVMSLFAPSGT